MTASESQSVCPRCGAETIATIALSPAAGVWELRQCERCLYTWRTTEPARRSQRDAYPDAFKLTEHDLLHVEEIPRIPPLVER
ncbi:non-oxidative hydroxyarylic acid decarboxylases subunit D [Curtobacterium sp. ISL-83]|uniref:non-oxidative hydroxyarylic acid decarboxylases subunit D n=1 Tax=Curtobacterium sp. ISL-83 TaxID=2819145 RepID=UPI001BE8E831|nr:non-oxidative hydroxyarylic acid decarboxylases subunit D [Curtobacterium sp. ISL-83]MBT2502878.1 hypothetical protein [Curtobacterium sp. ISL-83]